MDRIWLVTVALAIVLAALGPPVDADGCDCYQRVVADVEADVYALEFTDPSGVTLLAGSSVQIAGRYPLGARTIGHVMYAGDAGYAWIRLGSAEASKTDHVGVLTYVADSPVVVDGVAMDTVPVGDGPATGYTLHFPNGLETPTRSLVVVVALPGADRISVVADVAFARTTSVVEVFDGGGFTAGPSEQSGVLQVAGPASVAVATGRRGHAPEGTLGIGLIQPIRGSWRSVSAMHYGVDGPGSADAADLWAGYNNEHLQSTIGLLEPGCLGLLSGPGDYTTWQYGGVHTRAQGLRHLFVRLPMAQVPNRGELAC